MTDEQIKKALENCGGAGECQKCSLNNLGEGISVCIPHLTQKALDLINRQKAEIERLELALSAQKAFNLTKPETVEEVAKYYVSNKYTIKSEAIKDFAERLKRNIDEGELYGKHYDYVLTIEHIDNLVKEMVGE